MSIIDILVLAFFAAGVIWSYLMMGMVLTDVRTGTDEGRQGLRQFLKAAVAGYAWPLAFCVWVWRKIRKNPNSSNASKS